MSIHDDSVIGKLRAKIAFHEGEAKRLQGLIDALIREIGKEPPPGPDPLLEGAINTPQYDPTKRFAHVSFLEAVRQLLLQNGPMSAGAISVALLDGGFQTTSENPRRNFANMLDIAEKKGALRKSGDRASGVLWSLPNRSSRQDSAA